MILNSMILFVSPLRQLFLQLPMMLTERRPAFAIAEIALIDQATHAAFLLVVM